MASLAGSSVTTDSDSESEGGNPEEIAILLAALDDGTDDSAPTITRNIERALSVSLANIAFGGSGSDDKEDVSKKKEPEVNKSLSLESAYGYPLSAEEAAKRMPPGDGGLIWHSMLINGEPFDEDGNLKKGLNQRDFDAKTKSIKPRRASLPVLAKDFYSSLTRIDGPNGKPRFIFNGILNGWPSLQTFEVMSIQRRRDKPEFISPTEFLLGQRKWAHMWSADKEGARGIDPTIKEKGLVFRIKFRGPPWSSRGWSNTSPGFCFWYEAQKSEPTLTYGTEMIQTVDPTPICTQLHMVSHRYARGSKDNENTKDKITYHSIVLLEWDHGQYCTVIEAAYLNGLAGWRGKSNFFHDLNEPITQMYECFPPEMVCPWLTNAAEIRAFDVEAKSLEEFKAYISKYEGHDQRFVDANYNFSHPARLTYKSKKDIAQYLINYIRRDVSYSELKRNCQTLAADLCAFLAGKKEVLPYHPVNRIEYKNRSYLFLYDPDMYDQSMDRSGLQANRLQS